MLSEGFKRVSPIQDSVKVDDKLLHVNSVAGLVQAIGYIKRMVAQSTKEAKDGAYGVVFRGQHGNYPTMAPSLYRSFNKPSKKAEKDASLKKILNSLTIPYNKTIEDYLSVETRYIEPLLQHYGVETAWLDVVDNIWIALWFACHRFFDKYKPLTSFSAYPSCEYDNANIRNTKKMYPENYCFISLLSVPLSGETLLSGHYSTARAEVIDLRYCIPSFYLRPHAQHGLVMRMKSKKGHTLCDFKDSVEAVIRIDLSKALEWIKEDSLLSTRNLFPPPHIDAGLSLLLDIPELKPHLNLPMA